MKRYLRIPAVLALSTGLVSCVSTQSEPPPSAYGAFLAARYAGVNRDAQGAADFYAEALARSPGDTVLADRAFITALLAGEMDRAADYARQSMVDGGVAPLAILYLAADHMHHGRYARAYQLLDENSSRRFDRYVHDILMHWALLGARRTDEALSEAESMLVPTDYIPFTGLHQAMLFAAGGRDEQARQAYRSAIFTAFSTRMVTENFGVFLEQRGETDEARGLYQGYLSATPAERSISAALARLDAGGAPPRPLTAAQSAARAALGPINNEIARGTGDLSVLYLRIIQRLDPDFAPARIQLGEMLQRIGLPNAALNEYAAVQTGPFALAAQVDRIWLMARLDQMEAATLMARELVAESNEIEARLILADLLRVQSQCAEAADIYGGVIEQRSAEGDPADWRYHYFRAACLDTIDRWDLAEPEFQTALELSPDEAEVLNYLGYIWVDRGERLDEAMDMIRRAAELSPDSAHIIDSLGWAYYRLGDYDNAVTELERAAELDPGSATSNFHLGDAYWRVGRMLEAGFQWRRALDLEPDEDERVALEERLRSGLPAREETAMARQEANAAEAQDQ